MTTRRLIVAVLDRLVLAVGAWRIRREGAAAAELGLEPHDRIVGCLDRASVSLGRMETASWVEARRTTCWYGTGTGGWFRLGVVVRGRAWEVRW